MKSIRFGAAQAKKNIPRRYKNDNKVTAGKSLIIAGHSGFYGAAVLASSACARAGSGYTTLATDLSKFKTFKHPDFITLNIKNYKKFELQKYNALAVGPGLGISKQTENIIRFLILNNIQNVVADADALNVIAEKNLFPLPSSWVLTPHTGELARLLKTTSVKIEKNRAKFINLAQQKYQCVVLLKGPNTLIAEGGNIYKINSGNAALAKAGTGDVLTGIITGLRAQGLPAAKAACLGAYAHGLCAQLWVRQKKSSLSLLASDLINLIPHVFHTIEKNK